MTRPRIAIPEPTSTDAAYNERSLPQYIHSLEAAGATAVAISLTDSPAAQQALLASCAGILLPGSPADVDPSRYGQDRHSQTAAGDSQREAADALLLQGAFTEEKPVLGICYGLQSLNVWRGGTLLQHIPLAQLSGVVNHEPGRTVERAHPLWIAPDSRLASIWKDTSPPSDEASEHFVNSSHHQAVAIPGKSLRLTAVSPGDGVGEALEGDVPGHFVLGVQWHPERTYESSDASRAIFAAFVSAARVWKPCKP
jgi:putative glutamine amidotransferase